MGWANFAQMGVQNFVSGIQQYNEGKAAASAARRNAEAARMEAAQQASILKQQAKVSMMQAANAQRQGEIEANKRSRLLSDDIGSAFVNWAGNGLLVDDGGTFDDVRRTTRAEARFDINTALENAGMNAWTYGQQARIQRQSAANVMASGNMKANEYLKQAKEFGVSSRTGMMQSLSGVPSGVWQAAGITKYRDFGFAMGGAFGGADGLTAFGANLGLRKAGY